jgi:hypothetical protein
MDTGVFPNGGTLQRPEGSHISGLLSKGDPSLR